MSQKALFWRGCHRVKGRLLVNDSTVLFCSTVFGRAT